MSSKPSSKASKSDTKSKPIKQVDSSRRKQPHLPSEEECEEYWDWLAAGKIDTLTYLELTNPYPEEGN